MARTISSRTPEGEPNSCPLCGAAVVVERSILIGDATCPRCGQLLWFLQSPEKSHFFAAEHSSTVRDRILAIIADRLGVDRDQILNNATLLTDQQSDSLDTVELVMELEEELDPS